MFYGESTHSMDAKWRVHVPKRILDQIQRDDDDTHWVFLTLGFEGCIFLFSQEGYDRALVRMDTQPFAGEKARAMQRMFFSKAHRQQVDSNGRIVIPEILRERVQLGKEVVMVGIVDRAEIWPRARWEQFEKDNEDNFKLLDQVLCPRPDRAS